MSRFTDYTVMTSPSGTDVLPIVDVDDTTMSPQGTSKQITVTDLLALASGGVTSFNSRSGAVAPASGDYTAAQVGADAAGSATAAQAASLQKTQNLADLANAATARANLGLGTAATQASSAFDAAGAATAAQANAEAASVPLSDIGAANGVAQLDSGSRLPSAQLPAAITAAGIQSATLPARLVGGMTLGPPASGTWNLLDTVIDSSGNIWICTIPGTPGSWMQVVPSPPGYFYPENFGARGDGALFEDAAMTAANSTLTLATSRPFTPAWVGRFALVWNAVAGTYLFAQITGYTSASQVTLSVSASNTVTASGCFIASDDTSAWQQAISAAQAWSLEGNGKIGRVIGQARMYGIAGMRTTGGATAGNMQLALAPVSATSGQKSQVELFGAGMAQLPHWTQPQPPQSGTILVGMRTDGSLDNSNGPATVIGGPVNGFGPNQTFSNQHVRVNGLTIMFPTSSGAYGGIDLYGVGQASVDSFSYLPLAVVPAGTAWPQISAVFGNLPGYTVGLRMPSSANNAVADIQEYTCYFAQVALVGNEHMTARSIKTVYNGFGLVPMNSGGGPASTHGMQVSYWTCENTNFPVASLAAGYFSLGLATSVNVAHLSVESYTAIVSDAANALQGTITFDDLSAPGAYYSGSRYANAHMGIKLIAANKTCGAITSPDQPVAGGGTAWNNYYYGDAWIEANVAGGTFTSLAIDGVTQPGAAGQSSYRFFVPSGHSYTPVLSAGTVTHTVTIA